MSGSRRRKPKIRLDDPSRERERELWRRSGELLHKLFEKGLTRAERHAISAESHELRLAGFGR